DDNSILNHYRKIIKLRTENPALSLGSFETINIVSKNKTKIAVYAREYENNKFMIVHNFSEKKETVDLDFTGSSLENKEPVFKEVYGKSAKFNLKKNKLKFTNLEPLSTTIFTY
ncbi:MAG TPA: alpha-glucosidase C-terminal domain-containing protein, partial [Spirochaetota bacterium]|nr:alpha-glucosidase C-terminal domain-containing protein [Spirochaetota bacterium]